MLQKQIIEGNKVTAVETNTLSLYLLTPLKTTHLYTLPW